MEVVKNKPKSIEARLEYLERAVKLLMPIPMPKTFWQRVYFKVNKLKTDENQYLLNKVLRIIMEEMPEE